MIRAEIITDCMDLLISYSHYNKSEQEQTFIDIVNLLGSYPKPQQKGSLKIATNKDLGAYLFISNVRNACKLASIDLLDNLRAYKIIQINLINALSLLID